MAIVALVISLGLSGYFWLQIPLHTLISGVTVCATWSFIFVGPSPSRWELTASARIVPGRLIKRSYDQLT